MRHRTHGIAILALSAAAVAPATAAEPPFALELEAKAPLQFAVRLRNRSSRSQWVMVSDIQPTLAQLWRADGSAVPLQDDRATSKFDNQPYQRLFVHVPAGASVDAGNGHFEAVPGHGYAFRWGWMYGANIAAGCYDLSVAWHSRIDAWVDDRGQRQRRADLWLGSVSAAPLRVCLS